MQVAETFISINGEGVRAGEPALFIRFKGCNLACGYCDTMWANEPACPFEERSPEDLAAFALSSGIRNVTLTGGEPLLQRDIKKLVRLLLEAGLRVEVETNGAVSLEGFGEARPVFTMDYKLPSSGFESRMVLSNMALLRKEDTVKFVSGSRQDLERALEIIRTYGLTDRCHVYFSPVFGAIEPAEIVDFMLENRLNDCRLQIQMHKVIWDPDKRGV
jgi:7-carboxy-7-deazaguanine synthase